MDVRGEDATTAVLAAELGVSNTELPFAMTGGNVMFDGRNTAMSTCVMTNENRDIGVADSEFFEGAKRFLGIKNYHIIPNFEAFGVQHIDCLLAFLDENRILIARTPEDHASYALYESIVAQISQLKNSYGHPYEILRIDIERFDGEQLAAYTNALILNERVFVPLYGIDQDEQAMETWRRAMPGYEVLGFEQEDSPRPWYAGDAIHCRTRAIWDPGMLYMSHERMEQQVHAEDSFSVNIEIIDYSESGLVKKSLQLFSRVQGETEWQTTSLKHKKASIYRAAIPGASSGQTVEYYFSAADKSDRQETLPRTAPGGFFSFDVL
jgi:hypothetical protein